jgi:hypothetical protein
MVAATLSFTYGTPSSPTLTFGIANGILRAGDAVDSGGAIDQIVEITITSAAASTSSTGTASIYIAASADNGATYAGSASGTDGTYSGRKENTILARTIDVVANATTYRATFSVASVCAFMPKKWVPILLNSSGATFVSGSISVQSVSITSA